VVYDKILVPLDGSLRAEAVLPHVEELAHRYGASVILLRVVGAGAPIGAAEQTYAALRQRELEQATQEARTYLLPLQGQFREKSVETHIRVVYGRPVEMILKTAADDDVDLIAVASHGRSGLSRVFYGSVAAGLLQHTDRPLLLIPSRDGSYYSRISAKRSF
jgi:nucleotide-binding universal stress UspA family protein